MYLGKRGGGLKLFELFVEFRREDSDYELVISKQGLENSRYSAIKGFIIPTPSLSGGALAAQWNLIKMFLAMLRFLNSSSAYRYVFLMPSPWDFFLIVLLRLKGKKIITVVHDVNRHPGDFWPWSRSIKFRIRKSDRVIALSKRVNETLNKKYGICSDLVMHPILEFKDYENFSGNLVVPQKYILFIGRIRKYKGVDFLIDTFSKSNIEIPLVIAGQGAISSKISSRIVTINRWLSDSEIHWLILNAEVVVFPYSEATQSGLVPTCIFLEKKIVLSDAGALIEQAVYYGSENYFSYPVNSAEGLIGAISNALSVPLKKGARNFKDGQFVPEVSARNSGQHFVQKIIKIASQNG